jgi:vacuolar-type H+-ATPase subunit I/STV1
MQALREWQNNRRSQTISAVKVALERLKNNNDAISFQAVAKESGVARKTLYAISELRAMVLAERDGDNMENTLLRQTKRIAELEQELKTLKDTLYAIRSAINF